MLIVEDGTGVENANSYCTLEFVRLYAVQRGFALPSDNNALAQLMVRAVDYLETKEYRSEPTHDAQPLSFPRGVDGLIPSNIKQAQARLCVEMFDGVEFLKTEHTAPIIEDVVGPIKTVYGETRFSAPAIDLLLKPLLKSVGIQLQVCRA